MRIIAIILVVGGCVSGSSKRSMGGLSMHMGAGHVSDPSPDRAADTPTAMGAHLVGMYRLYPEFAIGLGLDSTQLKDETASGDPIDYQSYTGALTARLDTGRFAISTTAGYYVGARVIEDSSIFGRELSISGPGVGAMFATRLGITNGIALEVGPFIRFFHLRAGADEMSTEDYDERELRLNNLAYGVSIGIMLGGPPVSGVEPSF